MLVNGNTWKESCAEHALIGIPTILKHRITGISDDGQQRKSGTSGIGNDGKPMIRMVADITNSVSGHLTALKVLPEVRVISLPTVD